MTILFQLHGDKTWDLDKDALITFFRSADQTSSIIGQRQAATFQVLAGLSGHGELPEVKEKKPKLPSRRKAAAKPKSGTKTTKTSEKQAETPEAADVALTVRVEVNLPADADQATYDRIFKSIRENLINGG